ncbi:MAG: hypothetical protein HYX96_06385 [Chloroflexi bacterium]|nr:hypothetical protein [Chloroflexota bacterium]
MKKIAVAVLPALILLFSTHVFATAVYASSSVMGDPVGDAAPGYQDIVRAKVTEQRGRGTLFLSMEVASLIPLQPAENALYWSWHLDTDPNSAPYDWAADYVVHVHWDGTAFTAFLFDRRTTITTYVPFSIDGASVKVSVDLPLIGDPSSFDWIAATKVLPGTPDSAPDSGWTDWGH